jgi:hypothetical protein
MWQSSKSTRVPTGQQTALSKIIWCALLLLNYPRQAAPDAKVASLLRLARYPALLESGLHEAAD